MFTRSFHLAKVWLDVSVSHIRQINSPILSTLYRLQREEHCFQELETTITYDCININSVGNMSSPRYSSVNVVNIFNN